jgi:hypothetical protein
MPADLLTFGLLDAVDQWLHSLVVVRVGLHQVDDVEAVGAVGPRVANFEEVPLSVAVSSVVIFQIKVVLTIRYFDGPS